MVIPRPCLGTKGPSACLSAEALAEARIEPLEREYLYLLKTTYPSTGSG